MNVRFHLNRLQANLATLGFLVDIAMILLVFANLALIIFDWLFASSLIREALAQWTPDFFLFYRDNIHADFVYYDLMFVTAYLAEFGLRWLIAVIRRTHHRWFFYPFVHWYDLLGCIPVGSFRWLRVLRVVSLLHRLQRRGIIDLTDTYAGRWVAKYYNALIEEISDRVVINVLDGLQRQLQQGNPLIHRIEDEVLAPRRQALVNHLGNRIADAARDTHRRYRDDLGRYLSWLTDEAVANTPSGRRLAAIPVAGPRAIGLLGDTVREMGTALVDQLVDDVANPDYRPRLDDLLNTLIREAAGDRARLNELVRQTTLDILDQIKAEVAVQQWKLAEETEGTGAG